MGKATWISFVSIKDTAETIGAYGTLFYTDEEEESYHALIVDPRYDPSAVYAYLVELGATVIDLTPPVYS
jgi:hypothetical protein